MESHPHPVCEACGMEMQIRYPWTDYLLDIHHLLPLASTIAITWRGTSLADIVGICPSCHRAIHIYYRQWLKANGQEDFTSKHEAARVFHLAKKEIA
jgi:predicted HNH restriction endonuclease